jgi:hypothetical protein
MEAASDSSALVEAHISSIFELLEAGDPERSTEGLRLTAEKVLRASIRDLYALQKLPRSSSAPAHASGLADPRNRIRHINVQLACQKFCNALEQGSPSVELLRFFDCLSLERDRALHFIRDLLGHQCEEYAGSPVEHWQDLGPPKVMDPFPAECGKQWSWPVQIRFRRNENEFLCVLLMNDDDLITDAQVVKVCEAASHNGALDSPTFDTKTTTATSMRELLIVHDAASHHGTLDSQTFDVLPSEQSLELMPTWAQREDATARHVMRLRRGRHLARESEYHRNIMKQNVPHTFPRGMQDAKREANRVVRYRALDGISRRVISEALVTISFVLLKWRFTRLAEAWSLWKDNNSATYGDDEGKPAGSCWGENAQAGSICTAQLEYELLATRAQVNTLRRHLKTIRQSQLALSTARLFNRRGDARQLVHSAFKAWEAATRQQVSNRLAIEPHRLNPFFRTPGHLLGAQRAAARKFISLWISSHLWWKSRCILVWAFSVLKHTSPSDGSGQPIISACGGLTPIRRVEGVKGEEDSDYHTPQAVTAATAEEFHSCGRQVCGGG